MKITLESKYLKSSIELPNDDYSMEELIEQLIIPMLLSAGYQQETINKYFYNE